MARIQYQQSQGKGWSNIDPGYISLSRMREKQKEDEQGEDRRLREEKERDAQREADLQRVQKATEANLKEINIESQVSQTQEAALRVNKGIAEQNFEAETKRNKVKSTLETLVELAPSAIQAKQKMDNADWDVTAKAATEYYSTHGLEEARKIRTDLIEEALFRKGQNIEFNADEMARTGYSTEQVMFGRHKNSAVDYGLRKALAIDAGNNYKSTLQSALLKAGLSDPAEQEAFINDFNIRYLQGHGLYRTEDGKQISADFLGPVYEKMSTARSDILGRSRLNKAFRDSGEHTNKYIETAQIAIRSKSEDLTIAVDATNNAYERIKNTPTDIYGNLPTSAQARDTLIKSVIDAGEPAYAEKVLKSIPYDAGGQDTNMWDGNKLQISKLLKQKKTDDDIRKGLRAQADLAQQTAELDQFDADVKSGAFPLTKEALDEKFAEWRTKKYDQSVIQERFGHLTQVTPAGSMDGNVYLQDAQEKLDNHTATVEDLTNPKLPKNAFTQEQIAEVAKNQELLKVANYEDNFKENIDDALHNLLATKAVKEKGQKMDISLANAEEGARKMFAKCIIGGDNKNTCHKQLTDEIAKEDEGLFKKGQYGRDNTGKRLPGQPESYFVNFTFEAEQKKILDKNSHFPLDTTEQIQMVLESVDDETVKAKLFIHPDSFKALENRIERGLPFKYHDIAVKMSRREPDKYPTPMDFYREQAYIAKNAGLLDNDKAFNFDTLQRAWIDKAEEPTVKYKISTAQTNTDLQKGLELANNPSSARNPDFMSNSLRRILTDVANQHQNTNENFPFGFNGLPSPLLINYEEYNLSW